MVGGLWRIDNDNGGQSGLPVAAPQQLAYGHRVPSYPMPADWPDYPSHELMAQYLQKFAEHHDLAGWPSALRWWLSSQWRTRHLRSMARAHPRSGWRRVGSVP